MESKFVSLALNYAVNHIRHNTCGEYIHRVGGNYDVNKFGLSGVESATAIVDTINSYGVPSRLIKSGDGSHAAALTIDTIESKHRFLTDPFLMHLSPLSVTRLFDPTRPMNEPVVSEAYPYVEGEPSHVLMRIFDRVNSIVDLSLYVPRRDGRRSRPVCSRQYNVGAGSSASNVTSNANVSLPEDPLLEIRYPIIGGDKGVGIVQMIVAQGVGEVFGFTNLGTGEVVSSVSAPVNAEIALHNAAMDLGLRTREELEAFFRKAKMSYDRLRSMAA